MVLGLFTNVTLRLTKRRDRLKLSLSVELRAFHILHERLIDSESKVVSEAKQFLHLG